MPNRKKGQAAGDTASEAQNRKEKNQMKSSYPTSEQPSTATLLRCVDCRHRDGGTCHAGYIPRQIEDCGICSVLVPEKHRCENCAAWLEHPHNSEIGFCFAGNPDHQMPLSRYHICMLYYPARLYALGGEYVSGYELVAKGAAHASL